MANPAPKSANDLSPETPDARLARVAWERKQVAEADADVEAGRFIEGDDATRWLETELAEAQSAFEHEPE